MAESASCAKSRHDRDINLQHHISPERKEFCKLTTFHPGVKVCCAQSLSAEVRRSDGGQRSFPIGRRAIAKKLGASGEVGENGLLQVIDVEPKPYQKPHPPLFQAFSAAIPRGAATEGVISSSCSGGRGSSSRS